MNKIKFLKYNRLLLKKYLFPIACFIFGFSSIYAQVQLPDGVMATSSFITEIKKNYIEENNYPFDMNNISLTALVPVRVHIIKNIQGVAGIDIPQLYNSVITANSFFKNIGIRFFIDSVNMVDDYNYGFISNSRNTLELITKYAVSKGVNLFIADSVQKASFRSAGYTYFPDVADSNYIFLDKKYITGNTLTVLLGHYMGLLSTHENLGGTELASEKNCSTSGDYLCDTYADPDLFNQVDGTCQYTGTSRDESGKYYIPSVANMMSNSPDQCKCLFTKLQYRRMYYYFLKYRQNQKH